ncbi:MAG: hypothetical protein KBD23_06280 [Gammaproteobacteria bacterium]|nr:hypothetical protein [Gammaproteobacteria bacterium]MBP9729719.1 hypothetical protein [Gammaproteobacteria bacterium]
MIRFRGNITVTDQKSESRKAQDWVGMGGRAKTLRNASVGDPDRRDRLLLISSIAVFILTLLGAKDFLNCFIGLLEEQKNITDILWVI